MISPEPTLDERELLATAVDTDQLAAFHLAAEAVAALNVAALRAADVCGEAARLLGLDMEETLAYLALRGAVAGHVSLYLSLAALAGAE